MKIRIHESLYEGVPPGRQQEWKLSLNDLNHGQNDANPRLTFYGRRDGGLDLVLAGLTEDSIVLVISPADWTVHFDAYGDIITRLSQSSLGDGARSIETLDYAKKLIHDEAGEAVQDLLEPHFEIDLGMGRRLFTLIFLILSRLPEKLVKKHRLHL